MNLAALIARYRVAAQDTERPYFCGDPEVKDYLNEAQREAAIRGRMLRATAESLPELCAIDVAAGAAHYDLHHAMYELSYQAWRCWGTSASRAPLRLCTREWMDANVMYWRDMEPGMPRYLIQDGHALQLVPAPGQGGQLLLEGYHTPIDTMESENDEPGIPSVHHIHLVQWALRCAFGKPDTDFYDADRSARADAEFTRYFGARPDSDLRSETREDEPQHNVAW